MTQSQRLSLAAFVMAAFSTMASADDAVSTREADPPAVERMFVVPDGHNGWFLEFHPDGSVKAQYGSGPSDAGRMPAGTVDFDALVKAVRRLRTDEQLPHGTQVALQDGTEAGKSASQIRDDTLFRYLVDSYAGEWQGPFESLIGDEGTNEPNPRFLELLERVPIYTDEVRTSVID